MPSTGDVLAEYEELMEIRRAAFGAALEQLYLTGNPNVPEFEWRSTVRMTSWVSNLGIIVSIAIKEGLSKQELDSIMALIFD